MASNIPRKLASLIFLSAFLVKPCIALSLLEKTNLEFDTYEHIGLGNQVMLDLGPYGMQSAANFKFVLANGVGLTYGQIIALAGDFYGIPTLPITNGRNEEERKQNFIKNFNTLNHANKNELNEILKIEQTEIDAINGAIRTGKSPRSVYQQIGTDLNISWNCATGGRCVSWGDPMWLLKHVYAVLPPIGRYIDLAKNNFDHFGGDARLAYTAGHTLALQTAIHAKQTSNNSELLTAYMYNAFACHFASDLYAPGHVRTPRRALYNLARAVGSLLAGYMHAEDNQGGLYVKNPRGESWLAYGDDYYYDTNLNAENRRRVNQSMQYSADEIAYAYNTGTIPNRTSGIPLAIDYFPSSIDERTGYYNPMFDSNCTELNRLTCITVKKRDEILNKQSNMSGYGYFDPVALAAKLRIYRGSVQLSEFEFIEMQFDNAHEKIEE